MRDEFSVIERGYSPYIAAELEIGGERLALASMGPGKLVLRDPKAMPPGMGLLRTTLDQKVTIREVELPDGIDPRRRQQAFRVVKASEAVA